MIPEPSPAELEVLRARMRELMPPCSLTLEEHAARWRSFRDNCLTHRFWRLDQDQCDRGHPDDSTDYCSHCGYEGPIFQRVAARKAGEEAT